MKMRKEYEKLSKKEYDVLRKGGTEPAFSGKFLKNKEEGKYLCKYCGQEVFSSVTKFESGSGWPSFYDAIPRGVEFEEDNSLGVQRIEVKCSKCKSHLGHRFNDAPKTPTGKRYCINSSALDFKKK